MTIVYVETSIVSHATGRPSSDSVIQTLQIQAREWWDLERQKFEVVTSQLLLDEASLGNPTFAAKRLQLLDGLRLIPVDDDVRRTADILVAKSVIPRKAYIDALHVACAAVGGVEYLLTLNCRHIANAHALPRLYKVLEELGVARLLICTPAEFLGGSNNDFQSDS